MLGGGETTWVHTGLENPTGLRLSDKDVMVIAGDMHVPLDFTALRPLALKHGCDVLATFVDPRRSDHSLFFDIVLNRAGSAVHHAECRLWLGGRRKVAFHPAAGSRPVIKVVAGRLVGAARPRPLGQQELLVGTATGAAFFHDWMRNRPPAAAPF